MPLSITLRPTGTCVQCKKHVEAKLHCMVCADKHTAFLYLCPSCGKKNPFASVKLFIPRHVVGLHLRTEQIESLPTIDNGFHPPCARCGKEGAQDHHWAPKQIFTDDYHLWPTAWLCTDCHDRWHNTIEAFYARTLHTTGNPGQAQQPAPEGN